jgi:hypothetical protein
MIDNKQAFKELLEREPFTINRDTYTVNPNNETSDIDTRDTVYRTFLSKLNLSTDHCKLLLSYRFSKRIPS